MLTFTARACSGDRQTLGLGEGPVWDAARERMLWVDSDSGRVFTGRLEGDRLVVDTVLVFEERVGAVLPAADGGLVVAGERDVHVLGP